MQETTVYDLGEVAVEHPAAAEVDAAARSRPVAVPSAQSRTRFAPAPAVAPARFDVAGTFALLLPGSGHLIRRQWSGGLLLMSMLSFSAVLAWAVLGNMERIAGTLSVLGYPAEFAVWSLFVLYGFAALVHVTSVAGGHDAHDGGALHPVVVGIASFLVPGWGQLLNGSIKRAAAFVISLWCIGATWLLAAPQTVALLDGQGLFLPEQLAWLTSAALRWTLPAVVWALAVYDAAAGAAARR